MIDPQPQKPDPPQPQLPHQAAKGRPYTAEPVVVVQRSGVFRAFSWLGWMVAGLCLMAVVGLYTSQREYFDTSGGIQEKYHSLSKDFADNKIAIIDASGVIMSGEFVKQQIDQIREDDKVKGVILRVDSPGGTIYGSDYIYHHLSKLREERELPMVVSMGSMAASGGYYISMAVGSDPDTIFAEPMTTTGSIGVILPHYDITGLMDKFEVRDDSIATHPRKQMLRMTKALTEDDRQVLEQYIGHAFDRFKEVIKAGRPEFEQHPERLDPLATGEAFTAAQAKESGLIDEIGFIEDAIERMLAIAKLDKSRTRVVTYKRPVTLMDALALGQAPQQSFAQLLDRATPRAYYLNSMLPVLLHSQR